MLAESLTKLKEVILQLRAIRSLNSRDLHAHEMSSLNIGFGTTPSFLNPASTTWKKCSMSTEEHPPSRTQTSNHNAAMNHRMSDVRRDL